MKTIRRIQIGEAGLFKQIRLASLRDAPDAFSSTYDSALRRSDKSWREQADSTAQGPDRATYIAFSDNLIVGIAALYRLESDADVGKLLQVWIAPEHRGSSIAWDLVNTLFEWAGENNFRTVIARITDGNARALKFYIKYGFSISNEFSISDSDGICFVKNVEKG